MYEVHILPRVYKTWKRLPNPKNFVDMKTFTAYALVTIVSSTGLRMNVVG